MIENFNDSKNPSANGFVDMPRYVGVASVNVLAVNPNNEKLRKYGWNIPMDAAEPNYIIEPKDGGKPSVRVRLLVQITDLEEKPVISLDYFCSPDVLVNKEGTKCQIIDAYGRTAWGTKEEITAKRIPEYASGPAKIATPYKPCHKGEAELVQFLLKYLNVTPLQIFDRTKNEWVNTKNPGRVTIDNWNAICSGNISEIAEDIALRPDNKVKVVLGIRTTDDNKTYQTFLNTGYISNGSLPDRNTGEYAVAKKYIDKFMEYRDANTYSFSAAPVVEWKTTATEVEDKSGELFSGSDSTEVFDDPDDLPFD